MRTTDIAIVGGGLAGSTAAAMLTRAGCDFVIVDPDKVFPWDFRVEKLDASQVALLRKTGLFETVLTATTPAAELRSVRLGRYVHRVPTEQLGFYYHALVNAFRATILPERFIVGKVASIATSASRQKLTLSSGEEISARLLVLATGPNNSLRKSLGIERKVLTACQSISIGFDIKPVARAAFDFTALTYFPEQPFDPIAYITFFPIGSVTRANLFVYREHKDPWLERFRQAPLAICLADMPGLRPLLGEFEIVSAIKIRPIDLYETTGYRQAGVVLVGDAFSSSCPAAGTGANKALMDVERLCNVYIPRWLATEGMGREKIEAFYDDPAKLSCDAQSMEKAHSMRALSRDRTLRWRFERVVKRVRGTGRGVVELAKKAFRPRASARRDVAAKRAS